MEIKFTLAEGSLPAALASFGLAEDDAKKRDVFFFDAIDPGAGGPRLLAASVVLRLRRKKDGSGTTTLKLRPADGPRLTGEFRAGSGAFADYKVEIDWSRKLVLAASMNADVDEGLVAALLRDPTAIRELFGADQLRLLDEAGSAPPDAFTGLRTAGPISTHGWDDIGDGDLADLRAERWVYGEDRSFLELSLVADDLDRAAERRAALGKDLDDRGLALDTSAVSKTETALRELLAVP